MTRAWLRVAREEDLPELERLAGADKHAIIMPTHVFVKRREDGSEELIGYASVASVPLVLPWFDSGRCGAAESVFLINVMENLVAHRLPAEHPGLVCVPVVQGSPFEPHMKRLGYVAAGAVQLTFKKVK